MANSYFQFKQFVVYHDRCAMKVGTDAVLLGSWLRLDGAKRLLDIGCGSGVIALMAAQRCKGEILGVEIDCDAAAQALENMSNSPWSNRLSVMCTDIRSFYSEEKFDVIFSNPPYFINSLKSPVEKRTLARHTDGLTFDELMSAVSSLLSPDGEFSLIVPMNLVSAIKAAAISHLLYLSRETIVYTKSGVSPKRAMLAFRNVLENVQVETEELVLEQSLGIKSDTYLQMTKDFYL